MRKLSLEDYTFSVKNQQGIFQVVTYPFKQTLINVLTHPTLQLNGLELMEIEEVLLKIEKAYTEVLLTDNDYRKMAEHFKRFRGFSNNDREFVKRFYNCPEMPDDGKKVIEFSKN